MEKISRLRIHRLSELETSRKFAIVLQILNKRLIVDLDGEVTDYRLNPPFAVLVGFCKLYPLPETGKVVRNTSPWGHSSIDTVSQRKATQQELAHHERALL
jgi:hypothetical protein